MGSRRVDRYSASLTFAPSFIHLYIMYACLLQIVLHCELGQEALDLLLLLLLLLLRLLRPQPRDPAHVVRQLQLGDQVVLGQLVEVAAAAGSGLGAILSGS